VKLSRRHLSNLIKEELQRFMVESNGDEPEINLDLSKVFNVEISEIDMSDYPDFADARVESGEYEHAPGQYRELTQDEIDHLNMEESSWLHQQVWEQVF
jgi:hypothetical protein